MYTDIIKQKWIEEIEQKPDNAELLILKKVFCFEEKERLIYRKEWINDSINAFYTLFLGILGIALVAIQLQFSTNTITALDALVTAAYFPFLMVAIYIFKIVYEYYLNRQILKLTHAINIIELKMDRMKSIK